MRWFWVDRFSEYVAGSHAVGHKGVALSEEVLHDHWDVYPVMPNTLIAEGMAQTAGLLVSEMYDFKELVVLAKFTKLRFDGLLRPGETIAYRAQIGRTMEAGAQCKVVGSVQGPSGQQTQAEAEIFFARLTAGDAGDDPADPKAIPQRLFYPEDLLRWLLVTGVFDVGLHEDGSRMRPEDYGLPALGAAEARLD